MDSSDDEYEMLHATPAETAQWKKHEQQKKLWKVQTNQLEVLKVREKVISEMQENDCFQRELLKKKDEENAELKRTIKQMQQYRDEEEKRKEEEERRKEEEIKLIDSMRGMLDIEMDWMDRKRDAALRAQEDKATENSATQTDSDANEDGKDGYQQQLAPVEDSGGMDEHETIRSIVDAQCESIGCPNAINILNSAFLCVTCSLLSNLISIMTTIHQGEDVVEKQEEALISCAYLLADIISLLSFITHCRLFLVGKVVVEVLRLLAALIDDCSLAIVFHVVCLAVAVLWWRRLKEINSQLNAAREQMKCLPAPAAELVEDSAAIAA